MKIAVQILYTESWQPIADIVLPVAEKYCLKHGYNIIVGKYPEPCLSDFGYKKLENIKLLFENNEYDVIWSLDLDTLITNLKVKVEDFIGNDHDFYICKYPNGINAGSFIFKNTEWAIEFLRRTIGYRGRPKMYCEQDAFNRYVNVYGVENIKFIEHPSINSTLFKLYPEFGKQKHEDGQWEPGDFVLHLPALGIEKRIELLNEYKSKIVE